MISSLAGPGAARRTRPSKVSSARACSIARNRSGRSGWPGGTRCSRKIGSLTRSVGKRCARFSVLAVEEGLEGVARRWRAEELGEGAGLLVDAGDHFAAVAAQEPPRRAHRFRRLGRKRAGIVERRRFDLLGGNHLVDQPGLQRALRVILLAHDEELEGAVVA